MKYKIHHHKKNMTGESVKSSSNNNRHLTFASADRGARAFWLAFLCFQSTLRLIRFGAHSPSAAEHLVGQPRDLAY